MKGYILKSGVILPEDKNEIVLDFTSLVSGTYILSLFDDESNAILFTKKIILE